MAVIGGNQCLTPSEQIIARLKAFPVTFCTAVSASTGVSHSGRRRPSSLARRDSLRSCFTPPTRAREFRKRLFAVRSQLLAVAVLALGRISSRQLTGIVSRPYVKATVSIALGFYDRLFFLRSRMRRDSRLCVDTEQVVQELASF
ncbi:hypothetical protein CLOM_g5860 [Closterium sp. NIES-68]|nr:hypothetical protein CLOM_g5860 [Closterium sp. NIES-68]